MDVEKCENCDGIIGKLEAAYLFDGQIVCEPCKQKLDKSGRGLMQSLPRGYDGDGPATQKEIAEARRLGLSPHPDATRNQVRKLIDRASGKEIKTPHDGSTPSPKQITFARDLGVANPESFSRAQISDEIDIALACRLPRAARQVMADHRPRCQHCGGVMVPKKIGRHPIIRIIVNLSMLIFGIVLCFVPLLFILGVPMILIALFRSGRRKKVMRCQQCRAVIERA